MSQYPLSSSGQTAHKSLQGSGFNCCKPYSCLRQKNKLCTKTAKQQTSHYLAKLSTNASKSDWKHLVAPGGLVFVRSNRRQKKKKIPVEKNNTLDKGINLKLPHFILISTSILLTVIKARIYLRMYRRKMSSSKLMQELNGSLLGKKK